MPVASSTVISLLFRRLQEKQRKVNTEKLGMKLKPEKQNKKSGSGCLSQYSLRAPSCIPSPTALRQLLYKKACKSTM